MGNYLHPDQHPDCLIQPVAPNAPVTYKMTVTYDGKDFAGWQVQPGQRTVQGCIQEALGLLIKEPVTIHGSGRTDSGVHALGQVFHFRADTTIPVERMVKAVNTRLPKDIAVIEAVEVNGDFHARYDVQEKTYRYRILNSVLRDPLRHHYTWHVPEQLDGSLLSRGAELLVGTHDFAGFAASGSPRSTTVRTLSRAVVSREGDELLLEFTADGFLYHMVRNLAGTLVEIGSGKRAPEWIPEILAAGDRSLAGKTAPPQGLYLMKVIY